MRVNLSSLITIEVHARDLVEQLAESGCSSITEFDWVGQMRYYWTDDDLYVRQVEGHVGHMGGRQCTVAGVGKDAFEFRKAESQQVPAQDHFMREDLGK